MKEELLNQEFFKSGKDGAGEYLTVKDLKRILAIMPDDASIIIRNPDEEAGEAALFVHSVDTYWHGAVTLSV